MQNPPQNPMQPPTQTPMKKLWQFTIHLPDFLAFELSEALESRFLSVSLLEKDEKANLWTLQVLMEEQNQIGEISASLEKLLKKPLSLETLKKEFSCTFESLGHHDWLLENRKSFTPLQVGNFYIYGSHIKDPIPSGTYGLCLEASTAFGTGSHATTQGCLLALQDLKAHTTAHKPLDMGCGTGILAFAMAVLFKVPVWAVDNDPEALEKTKENATVNGVSPLIYTNHSEGWNTVPEGPWDLITANILAGPLCQWASITAQRLAPQGHLILSGLLNTQSQEVSEAHQAHGLSLEHTYPLGDWCTLVMKKTLSGIR